VARHRQAATRELAPQIDVREELTLFGRLSGMTQPAYEQFLAWAERKPWLAERPWLIWLSRALPVLAVGWLFAQAAGLLRAPFWLLFIGCNLALTYLFGKQLEETLDEVSERQAVFQPYAAIFHLIEEQPFAAPLLVRLQEDLAQERTKADEQMQRLGAFWSSVTCGVRFSFHSCRRSSCGMCTRCGCWRAGSAQPGNRCGAGSNAWP